MKKYDRETKKWISVDEHDKKYSPRDKSLCRGKKPHDYVLVLPNYIRFDSTYKFNPEEYYRIENETHDFLNEQVEKLKNIGIITKRYERKPTKMFMCSVCKKQKYEYE